MVSLIPIILFVLSASIDNFTVAVAYGCKNIKIGFLSNLAIAIISATGTFLSMIFGQALLTIITVKFANLLGSLALALIGLYFLFDYIKSTKKTKESSPNFEKESNSATEILKRPEIADIDKSGTIELHESLMLAFALSLNNTALGIAASIAGLNLEITVLLTFIFSLILIPLGVKLSKGLFSKFLGKKGPLISALIILIIAFFNLFS